MKWWPFISELPNNGIQADAEVLIIDGKGKEHTVTLIEPDPEANKVYIHMEA